MYRIVILSVFLIVLCLTAYSADTVIIRDTVYVFDSTIVVATNVAELKAEFYDRAIQGLESEKSSINTLFTIISIIFVIVTLATGYATYSAKKSREEVDKEIDRIREQRDTIDKEVISTRLLRVSVQNDADKLIDQTDDIRIKLEKDSEEIHGELKKIGSEIEDTERRLDTVIERKADELLQRAKQSSNEIEEITEAAKKQQIISPEKIAELIASPDAKKFIDEYEQIVVKYQEIDALQSLPSKLHKTAGMSYLHQRKYKEALFAFQRYLYIIPGDTEVNFQCAFCFDELSQHEEAIRYSSMAIISDPDNLLGINATSLYNWGTSLGRLYEIRNDEQLLKQAIVKFKEATETDDQYGDAYYNWGNALTDLYDFRRDASLFQQAIEKYEIAAAINDKDEDVYNNWGTALINLYNISNNEDLLEIAIEKFEKLLEINPKSGDSHYGIACVHSLRGQKENMLIALEKAINLDPKKASFVLDDEDFEAYKNDSDFLAIVKPSKDAKKSKGKKKN